MRRYKRLSGIYNIIHLASGRYYVGSAVDVSGRWSVHVATLRAGTHHCQYLQRAWGKYGEAAFRFRLVRTCPKEQLIAVEQEHLDAAEEGILFNTCKVAGSRLGVPHTEESRAKLAAAASRVANSPEGRKVRSERAKRMHAEGRIPPRPVVPTQSRGCAGCNQEFTPVRLPNGGLSGTKWCDACRPPHRGGRYKTSPRVSSTGNLTHQPKVGQKQGWKHSEEARRKIAKSSRIMWWRRKVKRTEGVR